ncbi:MAG TPA: hypothetical protein VMS64_19960 [Candidatus Methylomirabilis sp.]|nr:hypothetical protein [Candidatus Methylomirabilis sp.]
MGKLIVAGILFVLGMVGSRLLGTLATSQGRDAQRVSSALLVASRASLALGIVVPVFIQQRYLARGDGRLLQDSLGGGAVPFLSIRGQAGEAGARR